MLFTVLVQLLPRLKNAPRRIVPALLHRYLKFVSKWMHQVLFYHGERLVNEVYLASHHVYRMLAFAKHGCSDSWPHHE